MTVEVNAKGIVGLAVFCLVALLALETRPASDWIVRAMLLTLVIGGSVAAIVDMFRRKQIGPIGSTSAWPRGLVRWLIDEPGGQARSK